MMNGLDYNAEQTLARIEQLILHLFDDKNLIVDALKTSGGTHTFDDVAMMILRGQLLYWHLENSCIVGEVVTYPQRKALHFFLAAGDLNEITAMQPQMIETAKSLGCSSLSIAGRPGWKKPLGDLGWKLHSTTLWLDFTNIQPGDLFYEPAKEEDDGRRKRRQRDDNNRATGGNPGSV